MLYKLRRLFAFSRSLVTRSTGKRIHHFRLSRLPNESLSEFLDRFDRAKAEHFPCKCS